MAPSTRRSFRTVLLGLGLAILGLASCSSDAPASGVTQIDTAVVVAYKPCPGSDAAIEQLALYRADDPEHPIWEAQRQAGGNAVLDMPIRARYPGYDIIDRRTDELLDPRQRYSFAATATDGTEWGGPGFSPDELVQGKVRIADEELAFRDWVDSPRTCSSFGLFDALLTGLVVAGVAGLLLIALRVLTRRVHRADPGPNDPL